MRSRSPILAMIAEAAVTFSTASACSGMGSSRTRVFRPGKRAVLETSFSMLVVVRDTAAASAVMPSREDTQRVYSSRRLGSMSWRVERPMDCRVIQDPSGNPHLKECHVHVQNHACRMRSTRVLVPLLQHSGKQTPERSCTAPSRRETPKEHWKTSAIGKGRFDSVNLDAWHPLQIRRAYHSEEQVGPQVLGQRLGDLVSDTHAVQLRAGPEDRQDSVRRARRAKRDRQVLQRVQLQQQLQAALVHKLPGEGLVGQQRLEHARCVHDALGHMWVPVGMAVAWGLGAAYTTLIANSVNLSSFELD